MLTIDNIVFGNPSREDYAQIKTSNYLDDIFVSLRMTAPPKNSFTGTRQELNVIVDILQKEDPTSERFHKWQTWDRAIVPYLKNLFIERGADAAQIHALIDDIVTDVLPLSTKFKYEFNRPRPGQLAFYYQLKLMPYFSNFAHSSPSYPSGHVLICDVIARVLSVYYPQAAASLQQGVDELAYSRVALGSHYPTDNEFSFLITDKIIEHPEFRKKYKI